MNCKVVLVSVLSCFLAACFAEPVPIESCGSELAIINSIDISPCPVVPCKIKTASDITVTITFTSNESVTNATFEIDMIDDGAVIGQYPFLDTDGCNGMKCPFKTGEKITYSTTIYIYRDILPVNIIARVKMLFGSRLAMCFELPITFVTPDN